MPLMLYVGMVVILLNIITVLFLNNKTEYEITKNKFDTEQHLDRINNIKEHILNYYSNNYGIIHGDYQTSNIIKSLSNIDGDNNVFYIFNSERFCTFVLPTTTEETTLDEESPIPTILTKEQEDQKINFNNSVTCVAASEMYNTITSFTDEEKEVVEQLKASVGEDFYIRIDIETIKPMRYLNLPVLNVYLYDITKRHKPNISSEIRLDTDIVVAKKIEESKALLDNVANVLVEYGKRHFKGYAKLKAYNGTNAFSNLAEGLHINNKDGTESYAVVGTNSISGFQSTNVMMFPTNYMDSNSQSKIDNMLETWSNFGEDPYCQFVNMGFQYDSTLNWYSDNAYYMCKYPDVNNNLLSENVVPKPTGYCALDDYCVLIYDMDDKNKIININPYKLYDYLKSDIGFNFDMSGLKNPFFPNQNIIDNFNFILSSSNGNQGAEAQLSVNIGLRAINRPIGTYDNDTINLFDNFDFETNYLINKYYINF